MNLAETFRFTAVDSLLHIGHKSSHLLSLEHPINQFDCSDLEESALSTTETAAYSITCDNSDVAASY